jgi:hypothetical protein
MVWESSSIVLAGAAAAEGESRETDSDGSGSVCCHCHCESPPDPFRRPAAAAAIVGFSGGMVVIGKYCWKKSQNFGMAAGPRHCLLSMSISRWARNFRRSPSRLPRPPPNLSPNPRSSPHLRLHRLLQQQQRSRPARSPNFAPTPSSPFQPSPRTPDGAPRLARATHAAPLRTRA